MNTKVKQSIIEAARAAPHEEVCGLIYNTQTGTHILPCTNVSLDKSSSFEIDPQDYIKVRQIGVPIGVYHSHPKGKAVFSEEDVAAACEIALPFYLYAVETNEWTSYIPPSYTVPLIGREFRWGTDDCLEVVRIYYRQNRSIYMTDYDRDESFQNAEECAITKHISDEGFYEVPGKGPIKEGDVLLFKTPGTAYPHHLGVFVGKSRVLHHPLNMLSRIDPLTGAWLKRLDKVLRYGGKVS